MITGFLTALVWVCSMLRAPVATGGTQREIERALAGGATPIASSAPTVRLEVGGSQRHNTTHVCGGDAFAVACTARPVLRAVRLGNDEYRVPRARFRIAPHDATAPPAAAFSA